MILPEVAADNFAIRASAFADLPAIADIYRHHVLTGLGTFEETPPDVAEIEKRWRTTVAAGLPYLTGTTDGIIAGFAYAGPYRTRSAYRYTVEDSIYIGPEHLNRGLGTKLLTALIDRCTVLGYRQMVAVVGDSANAGSIALHRRLGFRLAGTLIDVGHKFGRPVDSVLMQRRLDDS